MLRHQMVESLTAPHPQYIADTAVMLWEQMARKIISIVGEGGFNSLYARSVFLSQASFPWLADCPLSAQSDQRFAELKKCFGAQAPAQACAANSLLLITFTDILASLIGEALTTSILRSAWGNDAPVQTDKDRNHD